MAGEVIVGYDGSAGARAALEAGVQAARAFTAPLVVAFGYEPSPMGGEVADLRHAVEELGHRNVADAKERVAALDPGLEVETAVVDQRPAESLIRIAQDRQARMIVVGSHGEGPIMGAILGSVPHKLVHRSPVPVLVVPAR